MANIEGPQGERAIMSARQADQAGWWLSTASGALALGWLGGAGVAGAILVREFGLGSIGALEISAIAFGAVVPAGLILFAGAAGRQAARARAHAQRLADAADRMMNPSPVAEAAAQRLSVSVRTEIGAVDRMMESVLNKLQAVEDVVARQSQAVSNAGDQAKQNAGAIVARLERERTLLMEIAAELAEQAASVGATLTRQTEAVSGAARGAENDLRAVDGLLGERLTSLEATMASVTERAAALRGAADASMGGAQKLDQSLVKALDSLAEATRLTDAARQSAEQATSAAEAAASSYRDAQRRFSPNRGQEPFSEPSGHAKPREPMMRVEPPVVRVSPRPSGFRQASFSPRVEPGVSPANSNLAAPTPKKPAEPPTFRTGLNNLFAPLIKQRETVEAPRRDENGWTWRDLIGDGDVQTRAATRIWVDVTPNDFDGPEVLAATQPAHPMADPMVIDMERVAPSQPLRAAQLMANMGVRLHDAFTMSALDRVALRARNGTQARRRAVRDAAPEAVQAIAECLAAYPAARQDANVFLQAEGARIAELLGRGRAAMGADSTRAFLLLDAASS